jgi:transposase
MPLNITLKGDSMAFIGIDLHTNCFTCCFLTAEGKRKKCTYSINDADFAEFLGILTRDDCLILEASCNSFAFVDRVKDHVHSVIVVNPCKIKLISFTKKKTDKIDAEKLAMYLKNQIQGGETLIEPVYVPPHRIRQLRSFFKTYALFTKQKVIVKNRIHSLLKQNLFSITEKGLSSISARTAILNLPLDDALKFQIQLCLTQLKHLESTLLEIKQQILLLGSIYQKEISILTSISGISVFIALAIIADIGTVHRFPNAKKFCSYLRSAPGIDSSNEISRNLHTMKAGRKQALTLLTQSLVSIVKEDSPYSRWFLTLKPRIGTGKSLMALCRKIFTVIYAMLINEKLYRYGNPVTHFRKISDYKRSLQDHDIEWSAEVPRAA